MYFHDQIVAALRNASDLSFYGDDDMVDCPRNASNVDDPCTQQPTSCQIGHDQKCKQSIKVFIGEKLLTIINLYFMYSPTDPRGFINGKDSALKALEKRGYISLSK